MDKQLFEDYLKQIYQRISKADAREESFYSALEKLILSYGQRVGKKTDVTILPKKSEAGQPDFRIWDGEGQITGYIEAKHPSIRFLDPVEESEQLKRYREAYPNVILTNFLEFRVYRNGVLWDKPVKISDYSLAQKLPKFPVVQHKEKLEKLLSFFFDFTQPRIRNPKTLAEILAYKAGIMRDYVVLPALKEEKDNYFFWLYQSFKKHLIRDLGKQGFADLFSQTFTYGLLIAKHQYEAQHTLFGKKVSNLPLTTKTAYDFIQKSFGILREVFKVISTQEIPKDLKIIVDDIVDLLNHTKIYQLLSRTSNHGKKDPIFHLYETFLLKYDKERKKKLGVFYTPLEVVSYIVNSTHTLLKDNKLFNTPDGLASYKSDSIKRSVTLLDPAVGTGTFLVNAIEKAIEEVTAKYSSSPGYVSDFIRKHILPHFFAFEILIAPYVVSHLKVLFSLTEKGFEFKNSDWLRIYLTNTLEFHRKETSKGYTGLFERVLVTEQEKALEVKDKTPILIVIGNPPYSVSSQNEIDAKTPFGKFYESYKENVRKEERNIQPLSDDYIKFLAFAHWKVKQTGKGIVGMITNNSYLDGLIHRDMRRKILEDFDLVYILNLHGDAKRPKTTKNGKKDENVFDIRQGVAICLLVKPEKPVQKRVYYQELVGPRENKYRYLGTHDVETTKWAKLTPRKPYWFLVPKDFKEEEKYQKFLSMTEIFNKTSSGVKTHRDHFVIGLTDSEIRQRLKIFKSDLEDSLVRETLSLKDTRDWKFDSARAEMKKQQVQAKLFKEYLWRPFDFRKIYYCNILIELPRLEVAGQMAGGNNLAFCVSRKVDRSKEWNDILVTNRIPDVHCASGQTYVFPLWLYETEERQTTQQNLLDSTQVDSNRASNIKQNFIGLLSSSYGQPVLPGDIFCYIYAILHSNIYRQKYKEFLKIDFPRIPFTKNYQLFKQLSKAGKTLVELHLLKSPLLNKTSARFEGNGGFVRKPRYDEKRGKVYINENQYFTNVTPEIWSYYIGGYQVLFKWLKDRKGRSLSSEEVNHYIKIITALAETIKIQKEIDKFYPKVEQFILVMKTKE